MINLKQELQGYYPIKLSSLAEDEGVISDNDKTAISLYNKALKSLKTGSEDIAIIELRKAISLKPNFYDAMNLLGICYSYINEDAKASEMFEKVISSDNSSVKASEYINLLNTKITLQKSPKQKIKAKVVEEPKRAKDFSFSSRIKEIVKSGKLWSSNLPKYITALVLGAVVMFFIICFIHPSLLLNNDSSVNASSKDNSSASYTVLENKNKDLLAQNNKLQKEKKDSSSKIEYYKSSINMFDIENKVVKNDYEGAAEMLVMIKPIKFEGLAKDKFEELYNKAMPKAAQNALNSGKTLFYSKKYVEAKDKFGKAKLYGVGYLNMSEVLIYIGMNYVKLGDSVNAKINFDKIIKNHPNTYYANWAASQKKALK